MFRVVNPFETALGIRDDGSVDIGRDAAVDRADDVVVSELPAGVRASVGAARMTESSKHRGERHPEGDELVYVISGGVRVAFDDGGEDGVVAIHPGELVVVPRGAWHRLVVEQPSEVLFVTPGRTEVRVR